MSTVQIINAVIGGAFFLCYAYQFFYLFVPLFRRKETHKPTKPHRFAVMIAARNETAVIGQLIDSVRAQDYPAELVTVCVVADNCTDSTASVARAHGARVYERHDTVRIGKGYALDFLLARLREDDGEEAFDAFLVLDADNLLAPTYLTEMNKTLSDGYEVVTGYRHSKNYGDNWISAGYGLWFLRESQQLNRVRMRLGLSCVVSGTGFAFTRAAVRRLGGWPFHSLTEDTEFTAAQVCEGVRVGYCEDAVLYDEQPITLAQSWRQRLRWAKGYYQVMTRYGGRLIVGALRGDFSCYDILASILPAFALSGASLAVNVGDLLARAAVGASVWPSVAALLQTVGGAYVSLWLLGGVTLCTEWRRISVPAGRKLGFFLLFPLFMLTYVPIAVQALVCRVEWTPVAHTRGLTMEQVTEKR